MSVTLISNSLQAFSLSESQGSCIDQQIWDAATQLIYEKAVLRSYLGKKPRGEFSGAIAFTGVDLNNRPHPYVQIKLMHPDELATRNGDIPKYRSPAKHTGREFDCFLTPGVEQCPEILERMGIQLPENKTFWQYIVDHPEIPILLTEGAKKAMCGISHGFVTIAIPGVWMGLREGRLTPLLERFAHRDRQWYLAFDSDLKQNRQVAAAFKELSNHLISTGGLGILQISWPLEMGKGLDDFIKKHGAEEFQRMIDNASEFKVSGWDALKPPAQSIFADQLAEEYRDVLCYDESIKGWMYYSAEIPGIWSQVEDSAVMNVVLATARSRSYACSHVYANGVQKIMQVLMKVRAFVPNIKGHLPCRNGLLNLESMEMRPYVVGDRCTWCLDIDYDPSACPGPILEWMRERLEDETSVNVVGAFFSMVLTGHNLQKYLELIGPGGTGKSTLISILTALTGYRNTYVTTLQRMNNRFEPANFYLKKLAVVTDAEKFIAGADMLKSLVARDMMPFEKKFQDAKKGFVPECGVVVAANEIPQTTDNTSGLRRRRLTIYMNRVIPSHEQRELIEIERDGKVSGEFAPHLPGFLNWVLSFRARDRRNYLKGVQRSPAMINAQVESMLSTNPIAAWADDCLYLSQGCTQVGVARKSDGHYDNESSWLFPNYKAYCDGTGMKAVSQRRFTELLKDLFRNQLKCDFVYQRREAQGSLFYNLSIRPEMVGDATELGHGSLPAPVHPDFEYDRPVRQLITRLPADDMDEARRQSTAQNHEGTLLVSLTDEPRDYTPPDEDFSYLEPPDEDLPTHPDEEEPGVSLQEEDFPMTGELAGGLAGQMTDETLAVDRSVGSPSINYFSETVSPPRTDREALGNNEGSDSNSLDPSTTRDSEMMDCDGSPSDLSSPTSNLSQDSGENDTGNSTESEPQSSISGPISHLCNRDDRDDSFQLNSFQLTPDNPEEQLQHGDRVMYIFYGCKEKDAVEHIYVGKCMKRKHQGRHWLCRPEDFTPGMQGSNKLCHLGTLANGHRKDGTFWKKP